MEEDREIIYIDEAGFYLNVKLGRTWAKKGHTPCFEEYCRYSHLSAISGISAKGELFFKLQGRSFHSGDVAAFLKDILQYVGKKITVIWDGAKIHQGKEVKALLQQQEDSSQEQICLVRIPSYSPDLNADEQVWQSLKDDMLKNVICKNIGELESRVSNAFEVLKKDTQKIKNYFKHPDVGYYYP